MANLNHDDEVISNFESSWSSAKGSLHDFVKSCDPVASPELQMRLVKCDLRLRLRAGDVPQASDYSDHFPQFLNEIKNAVVEEAVSIANHAMPIETQFGQLPQQVGQYEVLKQVGRDCVSVHYDAYQESLARKVRVRVLLFPSQAITTRACGMARLEHPCFETMIDVLNVHSTCIIVSQLEQGDSVAQILLDRPSAVSVRSAVCWIRNAAEALFELHRHDVEHLNVSPFTVIARASGGGVLVEPNIQFPPCLIEASRTGELFDHLPFPYRSIDCSDEHSQDQRKDDVVALGLVLLTLLTKVPLDSFYTIPPLPDETLRLKTLIQSQLDYSSEIDPKLKSLCLRTTLGVMDDVDPCDVLELRDELLEWEKQQDLKERSDRMTHDPHAISDTTGKSLGRRFRWFSK